MNSPVNFFGQYPNLKKDGDGEQKVADKTDLKVANDIMSTDRFLVGGIQQMVELTDGQVQQISVISRMSTGDVGTEGQNF